MFKRRTREKEKAEHEKIDTIIRTLSSLDKQEYWDLKHPSTHGLIADSRDKTVEFGFSIEIEGGKIILWNLHRNAKKGNGSKALTSLEDMLRKLANIENIKIDIIFETLDQTDTESWLKTNNYSKVREGKYIKTICPVKK